jgi:hypothetical protein
MTRKPKSVNGSFVANRLNDPTSPGDISVTRWFQLSLAWQRLVSTLQTLRSLTSAFSDSFPGSSKLDTRITEIVASIGQDSADLFSSFGDVAPVTVTSIIEFFSAKPELADQTEFAKRVTASGLAIDEALAAIPPGLGKARLGAREAFLCDPSLPLAALLARHSEGTELAHLADACDRVNARQPDPLFASMFTLDLVEPSSALFTKAINDFRESALEAAVYADGVDPRHCDLPITNDTHWLLHLAPRRSQLVMPLFSPMRALIQRLVPFQQPNGYWASRNEAFRPLIFLSAGIAHSLAVFGDRRAPENETALAQAIGWLETAQRPDGGWPIRADDAAADIVTTAFTADFLRRVGNQRAFERAAAFLVAKQHPAGLWSTMKSDADAHSVIVHEVLEGLLPPFPTFEHRLSLARDLFVKADDLARAYDEVSDQIALITAHQAVEMFLYSALEALDPPDNIWESNGQRTIGLRIALGLLEQRLIAMDGGPLRLKSQMQSLASARDGIVHKGAVVARSVARNHLEEVQRFLSAASIRALGYDVLG